MSQSPPHSSQFSLLGQRRFAPFFWTQFLGAANDNLFKFAFTVMVTYQLQVSWLPASQAGLAVGALFILPFILFSATSGQVADKYPAHRLIRLVKDLEVGIMLLGALGFWVESPAILLGCVFLMGLQSSIFGPVKYALLPQVLSERELTGGNGLVETGTFVAILLGNMAGGLLVGLVDIGHTLVAAACLLMAIGGRLSAQLIPELPACVPTLKVNYNAFSETWRNLKLAYGHRVVFRSLLGISWMWFLGAAILSLFPILARDVLHGDEQVASLLLAMFSVGIGAGSLLCEKLSRRHVEIGLVPLGALGMSIFVADLAHSITQVPQAGELMSVGAFMAVSENWWVLADLVLLALCAGVFSVPMYALVQLRSPAEHRARIIASGNILSALFMVASALLVGSLLGAGWTLDQVFVALGWGNLLVAVLIFLMVPEYLLRFLAWVLTYCVYRFRIRGEENIPTKGAAVLVCNHVSFADAVLLMCASPRPIRFLMDREIFNTPVIGTVFRLCKAIPVCSPRQDRAAYEQALQQAMQVLRDGDLLGIFPEGRLSTDGNIGEFKAGLMKVIAEEPAPVIPMALQNLWGSYFSRIEGRAMRKPFRRGLFSHVGLNVGTPLEPVGLTPRRMREAVEALHAERVY